MSMRPVTQAFALRRLITPLTTRTFFHWRRIFSPELTFAFPENIGEHPQPGLLWKYWNVDPRVESQAPGPCFGTKVFIQMEEPHPPAFNAGGVVKGDPTESEADVAADRCDEDPLPPGMHHTIAMPAGEAGEEQTDSEARVRADRSPDDPLHGKTKM
ncbi:hypothetical protein OQA88_10664 [Cercophora sp. LCS_1]